MSESSPEVMHVVPGPTRVFGQDPGPGPEAGDIVKMLCGYERPYEPDLAVEGSAPCPACLAAMERRSQQLGRWN